MYENNRETVLGISMRPYIPAPWLKPRTFFLESNKMGILEKIQDIENEIRRTQKNKG